MIGDPIESPRFIPGKNLVRDLCLREKDYIMANRLWYMSVLRDAYMKVNFKTIMFTKRVAIAVDHSLGFIPTPHDYLDMSSVSAPNREGRLTPMLINTNVRNDIADLSLAKRCGCSCGCEHDYCSSVRNFETILGTQSAPMPDGTSKLFNTSFRKIILEGGAYVEETVVPVQVIENNVHVDTKLEKTQTVLCNLDIKDCGCIKNTPENRDLINLYCNACDVEFDGGCSTRPHHHHELFNMDEVGDKIFIPSHFRAKYVVLRYFANSKTKNLMIPFLAKEAVMSQIKVLTSKYDASAPKNDKAYWAGQYKQDRDEMVENLNPVMLTSFLSKVLAKPMHMRSRWDGPEWDGRDWDLSDDLFNIL